MLKNHFKKFHDLDVKELSGIAIMTDTDNSKLKAICLLSKYLFFLRINILFILYIF